MEANNNAQSVKDNTLVFISRIVTNLFNKRTGKGVSCLEEEKNNRCLFIGFGVWKMDNQFIQNLRSIKLGRNLQLYFRPQPVQY